MKRALRSSLIVAGILMGLEMFANAKEAGTMPQFSVCVRNYAGVPVPTVRNAEMVTRRILRLAGVETTWQDYSPSSNISLFDVSADTSCMSTTPRIYVNLVADPLDSLLSSPRNALGAAPDDPTGSDRNLVFVFDGMVNEAALMQRFADKSEILGHAMAHEMGHILAHIHIHEPVGLMRAMWQPEDFLAMAQGALGFSSAQAAQIRLEVTRRTSDQKTTEVATRSHEKILEPGLNALSF